jgi:hypothetical protein
MRKNIFLFVGLFFILLFCFLFSGCSSNNNANAASEEPKPILHVVERESGEYLADENETILYSLSAPYVSIDMDRKVFVVHPHVYYAPGTTYYGSFYDGFKVVCSGGPRSGVENLEVEFGPEGGELPVPKIPYNECRFEAFVVGGEEVTFETKSSVLYFNREE